MPQKIQRSTLNSISPNGYAILNAIGDLTAKESEKSDPFAFAAISAVKHEATMMTIEAELKAKGIGICYAILREELNTLKFSDYVLMRRKNIVGQPSVQLFTLTDSGRDIIQRLKTEPPSAKPSP